jgi:hypothetical protein
MSDPKPFLIATNGYRTKVQPTIHSTEMCPWLLDRRPAGGAVGKGWGVGVGGGG